MWLPSLLVLFYFGMYEQRVVNERHTARLADLLFNESDELRGSVCSML
jgi:hypothetical protein